MTLEDLYLDYLKTVRDPAPFELFCQEVQRQLKLQGKPPIPYRHETVQINYSVITDTVALAKYLERFPPPRIELNYHTATHLIQQQLIVLQ